MEILLEPTSNKLLVGSSPGETKPDPTPRPNRPVDSKEYKYPSPHLKKELVIHFLLHLVYVCGLPSFNLLKGTCKSRTELEYHFEECFKVTTERLDWHNPEGKYYPFDLRKPLPLIPNHQGRHVIPFNYFINNEPKYMKGGSLSRKYSTSITKTKGATYEVQWIEDMVPNIWSPVKVVYDKHAYSILYTRIPNVNNFTCLQATRRHRRMSTPENISLQLPVLRL
nr:hypothetical protein [Tanacetum cinerariifolium]